MLRIAFFVGLVVAAPVDARDLVVEAGPNGQERLQTALLDAKPGDVVRIGAGRFDLTDGLSLDVAGVTIRGAGPDKSVLSFKGQLGSGEGLLVTSKDVVLRDFAVEDTKGDGIKSKGADRIVYYNIRVEWTGGPKATNGAYGVYPVSSTHVLIDGVTVKGASDAGIYVGQSEQIIVRNSHVAFNVAGIEIENSRYADVFDNVATRNTGGILVFDMPSLPRMNGGAVRVFNNRSINNDTPNFAPKGNFVATVPRGSGILIMANDNVHIFGNEVAENATSNIMIAAYREPYEDPKFDPVPSHVVVRGNDHGPAGFAPDFPGGDKLAVAFGGALPPILWDGVGDPATLHVNDKVPVLGMGLKLAAPIDSANPAPVELTGKPAPALAPIVLPASMEQAVKFP